MTSSQLKSKVLITAVFVLSILASSFTLYSQSLRLDESQSIWVAIKSVPEILNFIGHDVHVPLYFLILHFWMQILGTDVIVTRSLSLIFFIISLFAVYKLVNEVSSQKIAIITVCLFALSPFIVWYASEIRMYTLFVLISTLQNLFFVKFFNSDSKQGKFWLFITMLLGIFTHYFFVFQIITQAAFLVLRYLKAHHKQSLARLIVSKKLIVKFGLITAGVLLFFLPWVIYVYTLGAVSNTQPLISRPTTFNIFQTFVNFLFGFQPQNIQSILVSLWPLLIVVLFIVFTKKFKFGVRNLDYFMMMAFLPVVMVFIISFLFRPLFLSRYLIFVTPSLFLIIAWVLSAIITKKLVIASIFLLVLSLSALAYQNVSAYSPVRENYQQVANYLNQKTTTQDIIAVSAPFTIYPIEYYYKGLAEIDTIPSWDRFFKGPLPTYSRQALINQLKGYKSQSLRLFVVFSYDQGYEKDIRDYLDHNVQLMGSQRFSQGLEVRVYKLRYDVKVPSLN